MKFSHRSKLNDIPSRNIEESIRDKKINILNAFFVIKRLQKHMSKDISYRTLIRAMILDKPSNCSFCD